ncbi:MAG: SCP2 sterol-binding domain-containing protein [Anaerolineae bacterium]
MTEPIQFATDAWIKQLHQELNTSEAYAEAAKNWEGDLYFVVEAQGSTLAEDTYLYMDLWHGKSRQARLVKNPNELTPEFVFRGSVKTFKEIIDDGLDPIKAMLTRKLKLTGNMAKIMRNVKAANELVRCCTLIPTGFPLE